MQFTAAVINVPVPTLSRLAFRYVVTDISQNGDIVGIDTVTVDAASSVPEPARIFLCGAGIALLGWKRLRVRA